MKDEITSYRYDKNGNTLVRESGTQAKIHTGIEGGFGIYLEEELPYTREENTYNVFNQLVSTKTEDGTTADYIYYPNNLRFSKQVTKNNNTTYTGFMWDGSQTVAEFDVGFNLTNTYMFGRKQKRIMGTNLNTNVKTCYAYNAHGDVEALANASGTVTKTYRYDAFGNEMNKVDADTNPWRYCGEYYDTETDNIYLRNRYYNPSIGRFINEDPIRDGGNWYSYCMGNPILYDDFSGLRSSNKAMVDTGKEKHFDNGVSVKYDDNKKKIIGPVLPDSFYGKKVTTREEINNLTTVDILARAIYAEDSDTEGQKAVAWVIINKVLTGEDANVIGKDINIRNVVLAKGQFTSLEQEGGNSRAYCPEVSSKDWKNALFLAEVTVDTFNTPELSKTQIRNNLSSTFQNNIGTMTTYRASYQWKNNYNADSKYLDEIYGGYVSYYYQIGGNVFFRLEE